MADYFLVLDGDAFEGRARPALAAAWRQRSFEPCRALCADLIPAAHLYAQRYHTGPDEPLLCRAAGALPFDRALWRTLVGEVLLFSALEIPEFQASADSLCCLLAPDRYRAEVTERERLAPIQQVHRGSRDLTFGAAVYRPDHAGYNNRADVARLAAYLAGVQPEAWTLHDLRELRGVTDDEERADELEFVREWFPALRELYERAGDRGQVIVFESIW